MNTESPRIRAMLAGCAALVVFGITIPATATTGEDPVQGPPSGGDLVGQAHVKADPKGQDKNDKNKGFTCDENGGVGNGNPALNPDCGDGGEGGGDYSSGPKTDKEPGSGSGSTDDSGDWGTST